MQTNIELAVRAITHHVNGPGSDATTDFANTIIRQRVKVNKTVRLETCIIYVARGRAIASYG